MRWLRPSYSSLADMIALARDLSRGWRAGAEPAVPLERGDRRRQPVQSHAGGARRVLRSAGAVPRPLPRTSSAPGRRRSPSSATRYCAAALTRPRAPTATACISSTSRRICRRTRRPTRCCPWQLGTWALEAGDTVEYVAHPPRAPGHADLAGPVTWVPRRTAGGAGRAPSSGLARPRPAHPACAHARVRRARMSCTSTATACWRSWLSCWAPRGGGPWC